LSNPGDLSLADRLERIESKLDRVHDDVLTLRVRASLYGSLFGGLGALVIGLITKYLGG
jgi:hypothetical protein